jgi:putative integral membrane protein (TIGR02587 family)
MLVIALRIQPWQPVLLAVVSLAAMHAFVYSVAFRGGPQRHRQIAAWSLFLRYSVTGYALALLLSAAMLWWFGRFEGLALVAALRIVVVLGFPAAVGAAAARLIL